MGFREEISGGVFRKETWGVSNYELHAGPLHSLSHLLFHGINSGLSVFLISILFFPFFAWGFLLFFGPDGMRGCVVLVEENVQG